MLEGRRLLRSRFLMKSAFSNFDSSSPTFRFKTEHRALLSQVKGFAKFPVRKSRECGFLSTAFEILKAQIPEIFERNAFFEQTLRTGIFLEFADSIHPVGVLIVRGKANFMER